jgi:hypothetical protein
MPDKEDILFVTCVSSVDEWQNVIRLIASLRSFGGIMSRSPFLVFHIMERVNIPESSLLLDNDVRPLDVPADICQYWYGFIPAAMAQAEQLFGDRYPTLTWINPACLILNPPLMYHLDGKTQVAFRPVHIRNIGSRRVDPVDKYWQRIYRACGIEEVMVDVESFVDEQKIRAYYNTHALSIKPGLGLMKLWLEIYASLVTDRGFQADCCQDEKHRIFLFQAVLSALVSRSVDPDQVRLLPPEYNYPYNLQSSIPANKRAVSLDALVSLTYEGRPMDPAGIIDIEVPELYRTFLRQFIL